MSVGTNSIKRAAKTANGSTEAKKSVGMQKETEALQAADGTAGKALKESPKKQQQKSGRLKAADKPAGKKPEKATGKEPAAKKTAQTKPQGYEAYGIGQQLPVHLL